MIKSKRISKGHYRYSCGESWIDVDWKAGKWVAVFHDRALKPADLSAEFSTLPKAREWAHDTLAEYA